MTVYPFTLGTPLGTVATLGLIVLQSDETIEHDFRRLIPLDGVALHAARIESAPAVRRETLVRMEAGMTETASRLPRPVGFDAVGYACTSGASVIGSARVAALIRAGCATRAVTDPLAALVAACRALSVTRLALLSPYVADVSDGLRAVLAAEGIATPVFGSFDEAEETRVARIDAASIRAAVTDLSGRGGVQAVFLSCTNLRTLDVIAGLEAATSLPILSSNQVLAWHMLRQSGVAVGDSEFGRLMRR